MDKTEVSPIMSVSSPLMLISIPAGANTSGSGVASGVGWLEGSTGKHCGSCAGVGDGDLDILTSSCFTIQSTSVSVVGFMMSIGFTLGSALGGGEALGISAIMS